jgi:hypothetical protein
MTDQKRLISAIMKAAEATMIRLIALLDNERGPCH